MGFTQRLEDTGGDDVATAGGGGANLGELTRAGFPVPPGFVILTGSGPSGTSTAPNQSQRRLETRTRK